MCSIISLQFLNERNIKNKVVYNKGEIFGRPKTAKEAEKEEKKHNKQKQRPVTAGRPKLVHFPSLYLEKIEKPFIGDVLKNSFTATELAQVENIDPNPKVNRKPKKKKKKVVEKLKPYIPIFEEEEVKGDNAENDLEQVQGDAQKEKKKKDTRVIKIPKKEINVRYLKKTIKDYENNDILQHQIKSVVSNSKVLQEYHEKEEKNLNTKPKEKFVPINDIKEDKKYVKAAKDMERVRKTCDHLIEYAADIGAQLKKDQNHKVSLTNQEISSKGKVEVNTKANTIIKNVKQSVDPSNFDINTLNEKDRKLLAGAVRYKPQKRPEKKCNIDYTKNKVIQKSKNTLKELSHQNRQLNREISNQLNIDYKEEMINEDWKISEMFSDAYINNYNKGKIRETSYMESRLGKKVEGKEDIYDYIYFSGKEESKREKYEHPFLIYD